MKWSLQRHEYVTQMYVSVARWTFYQLRYLTLHVTSEVDKQLFNSQFFKLWELRITSPLIFLASTLFHNGFFQQSLESITA